MTLEYILTGYGVVGFLLGLLSFMVLTDNGLLNTLPGLLSILIIIVSFIVIVLCCDTEEENG